MLRPLLILIGVIVCAVTLRQAVVQHHELASLQQQERALRAQPREYPPAIPQTVSSNAIALATEQHTPSTELLRLRGQVGQLERRKRELAGARPENERLRVQFASKGTNATGGVALPAGYLRKAEAKLVGYHTPESTLQSMLWAIQNRDTAHFVQVFNPEMARQVEAEIQKRASAEEFFKEVDAMPGLRIIGREAGADDTIVLTVEMLPGDDAHSQQLHFRQFDGQWKLMSGF